MTSFTLIMGFFSKCKELTVLHPDISLVTNRDTWVESPLPTGIFSHLLEHDILMLKQAYNQSPKTKVSKTYNLLQNEGFTNVV